MSENGGADRSRDEADRVDRERLQRADPGIGVREIQFCEDQARDGAVKEEIVPFDRGAHRGRDDGAAKLNLMFAWREGCGVDTERCHACFLRNAPD
jgi:hypothetical protein